MIGNMMNTFNIFPDKDGFESVWDIDNQVKRFFYHFTPITILLVFLFNLLIEKLYNNDQPSCV
jgi:hypothetical protein